MIRRPPRSTHCISSAASDVYKRQVRKQHAWLDKFNAVTMSCDLGVAKPHPEAFKAALQNLGSTPEDTVFFDDNPDNVAAARALGIAGVVFRNIDDVKDEVERNF